MQASALKPEKRELVFDIDMTDYDEIRTCCSGGNICVRCWGYIAAAVKVLDHSLRGKSASSVPKGYTDKRSTEIFGFQHLLWVYSGRRGIHCWISDRAALDLSDDQRKAITNFLEVIKGGKEQLKKVNVRGSNDNGDLHPALL
jgi:DNA primase small subunit